jgi:hypothetical protein
MCYSAFAVFAGNEAIFLSIYSLVGVLRPLFPSLVKWYIKKMVSPRFNYSGHRNSYTELNEIYFWTITINKWNHLLQNDDNKLIVFSSLQWLVQNKLVDIYGYVIMPNHIHLLWQQLKMNGKEFPKNSFEKFTAKSLVTKMKHPRLFT